jgi:hypothetical protein
LWQARRGGIDVAMNKKAREDRREKGRYFRESKI